MNLKPKICAIVAVGPGNVIGKDNVMPWHCPADLRHFKITTMGYPCVFGRKTFEGMGKKPLIGRQTVVISRNACNDGGGLDNNLWAQSSIERAIYDFRKYDKIFVCGGAQIYKYVLDKDLIDVFYLTEIESLELKKQVQQNPNQYTYFPVNLDVFLSADKWAKKQIKYPNGVLPNNPSQVKSIFWEYTRIRNLDDKVR